MGRWGVRWSVLPDGPRPGGRLAGPPETPRPRDPAPPPCGGVSPCLGVPTSPTVFWSGAVMARDHPFCLGSFPGPRSPWRVPRPLTCDGRRSHRRVRWQRLSNGDLWASATWDRGLSGPAEVREAESTQEEGTRGTGHGDRLPHVRRACCSGSSTPVPFLKWVSEVEGGQSLRGVQG